MKAQSIELETISEFLYRIKDKKLHELTSSDITMVVKYENDLAYIQSIGVCKGRGLQAVNKLKSKITAKRIVLLAEFDLQKPITIEFN